MQPRKLLALALVTAVLAGCTSGGKAPVDHHYRLPAPRVEAAATTLTAAGLAVRRLDTDSVLGGLPLAWSGADHPLRLNTYPYYLWIEPPARMVQRHLVDYLSAAAVTGRVYDGAPRDKGDYTLDGHLLRFEQHRGATGSRAVVELNLVLRDPAGRVIMDRRFTGESAVDSQSIHETVAGLSRVLQDIERDLVGQLRSVIPPAPR